MTIFASSDLEGKSIGTWKIGKKIANIDKTTQYSLFYHVSSDGVNAIMKVLDVEKCNTGPLEEGTGRNELVSRETTAFHYETKVAKACAGKHMNNVIRYIESGEVDFREYSLPTVTYIIYEQSEGKIEDFLDFSSKVDFVSDLKILIDKLHSLHEVAKGVNQLHINLIAHHNITPQSIEVFETNSKFKLSGLHTTKSQQDDLRSPDNKLFNGDFTYAPPEAFFANRISDEMGAYYQIDTYMLGNMIVYYLTSLNVTTLLNYHLPYSLKTWASQGANYQAILPEINNAFCKILADIKSCICVEELQEPVIKMIECLCNPDPEKRGYPGDFSSPTINADLQRVITKLDILYREAQRLLYQKS